MGALEQGPGPRRVVVTGASGFIGGRVLAALANDPRFEAVATSRSADRGVLLDLTDPTSMPAALAGADAVIHCAIGPRPVAVDGTAALLDAAAAAGVRRVVHLSSIAVYGDASGTVDESTPLTTSPADAYARDKIDAEAACVAATGVEVVRLRPTIVYGPGSHLWIDGPLDRIATGQWPHLGPNGEGWCNPVYVDDVAAAAIAAVDAPTAVGSAYNVNGSQTLTWNQWHGLLAAGAGLPPLAPRGPLAYRARRATGLAAKIASKLLPARLVPRPVRTAALVTPAGSENRLFALAAYYPADAARLALGWEPEVELTAGLEKSLVGRIQT